jgi:hypothetical protein
VLLSSIAGLLAAALLAAPAHAATFVVDDTGDAGDSNPGNGTCKAAGNVCTLRAAIEEANALAGADTITFNIAPSGAQIITPASALTITQTVTIDATTQPGWVSAPIIELSGTAAGGAHGINISGAASSGTTIKGFVIDRYSGSGIAIRILAGSSNNVITGNYIGVDPTGALTGRGNSVGVYIQSGSNNRIGGTTVAERNVISGNRVDGIQIDGTTANIVQGNYIGLNAAGAGAIPNTNQGIAIFGSATNNVIGGTAAGAGNVISGNGGIGITISVAGSTGNRVEGNFIGTDAAGTGALANQRGIDIGAGAANNTIGGTAAGAGNRIAFNSDEGVVLVAAAGTGNLISSNQIYSNTGLGIDLSYDGLTANDSTDADVGANNLQNFPVLSAAMTNGAGSANFAGALTSTASTAYRIEFFASAAADPGGYGEGQRYLGFANVTTDAAGKAVIGVTLATSVTAGEFVSATATDPSNNTSEFSAVVVAVSSLVVTTTSDVADGTTTSVANLIANPGADGRISLREAIVATNATAGADTVRFGIPLTDPNHLYYRNDAIAGSLTNVQATTLADTATASSPAITDFDPDYPAGLARSWYRIQPATLLATIQSPLTLDGTTQPGALVGGPVIEVYGASIGGTTRCLSIIPPATGTTIKGLVIDQWTGEGITSGALSVVVQGNYIGTDPSGTKAQGNGITGSSAGIYFGGDGSQAGGVTVAERNIVSGNHADGIWLDAKNLVVQGNYIGTDVTGTNALGNTFSGVVLSAVGSPLVSNVTVGGVAAGSRNVISANGNHGVLLSAAATQGNFVQGNYIGTNATGTASLGNAQHGVRLAAGASGNTVGGTSAAARNVLSGNGGQGVRIDSSGTSTNVISGNFIGTNAAGTAGVPNTSGGIAITSSAASNTIGGTAAGAGNVIAYNTGGDGINVAAAAGTGNSILGNSIFANAGLGIDLLNDGVTANDALDADTGPNDLLNYPLLTSVFNSAGTLTVNFKLDVPAGSYRIEFFKNPSGADPTSFGEGEMFAASGNVTHPGGGAVFFAKSFAGSTGDVITATATACTDGAVCAAFGSTSEFAKTLTAVPTAVTLLSFTAAARDHAIDIAWQTGSEIGNLGFHLYRSSSAAGPYARITSAVIPGLGTSPFGTSYSYQDAGLTNGATYYYVLEDIETTGGTNRHGPVSAMPAASDDASGDGDGSATNPGATHRAYGDPTSVRLRVVERDASHAVLELETGGFFATTNDDGSVTIDVPSFEDHAAAGQPAVPTRRAFVEATSGRRVRIASVEALDTLRFPGLRPAVAALPSMEVSREGIVRPGHLRRREAASFRRGVFPPASARLRGTAFQGETKKAELDLAPLRYHPGTGELVLSRRLRVRVEFLGTDAGETSLGGSRGRRMVTPVPRPSPNAPTQLIASSRGLYRARFEEVFPGRRTSISSSLLALSRQGEPVPFFVDGAGFGPGTSVYFFSEGAALVPEAREAVYELAQKRGGLRMGTGRAAPADSSTTAYRDRIVLEQNKTYQPGLLDAPDPWLWQALVSPVTRAYAFTADGLAATSAPAHLTVWLQGASDFEADPDHHVRVYLNGTAVGETSWNGQAARTIEAEVTPGLLVEGANTLEVENVGDTAAAYSMVFLDKFAIEYARVPRARDGVLEGVFTESGTVEVQGLGAGAVLLDTTEAVPRWLTGATSAPSGLTFRAESGHRYFAASPAALLGPAVRHPARDTLRSTQNQADYLLIAPRELLATAAPLLALRESQGLRARGVAVEDIYDAFGHGEEGPAAVKAFLSYAYQAWKRPSPRYVVLLGDATYDPKDYLHTGVKNRIPTPLTRTTYLWTASDPSYAAVNGEDALPDLALGRLPAANMDEARAMVEKVVAFESAARDLSGPAVLVADNPDAAGDFEAKANDLAATVLAGRAVEKLFVSEKGASTRAEVAHALDQGASLMSYVGHGSIAVWASENVWNNQDVGALAAQGQQPILFTMNCLNGFFHFPPLDSLAESFVKADGKGAVAAVSPSGLSLDEPAHVLHKALLAEIVSGRHERLGDAVLAAQAAYADSGAFPELLAIYHLFGDPALRLR